MLLPLPSLMQTPLLPLSWIRQSCTTLLSLWMQIPDPGKPWMSRPRMMLPDGT